MRIALAQLNPVVGDTEGNLHLFEQTLQQAAAMNPELVVFPELFITGYPPRDLLHCEWFVERVEQARDRAVSMTGRWPGIGVLFGCVGRNPDRTGRRLLNCAVLAGDGRELFRQSKSLLPNYDVFDEARYFEPARQVAAFPYGRMRLGITICEDVWNSSGFPGVVRYDRDPVAELAAQGADVILNIAASPFRTGVDAVRLRLAREHARKHGVPFVMLNQVGGNDELVFDGRSIVLDRAGRPVAVLPAFEPAVAFVDTEEVGDDARYRQPDEVESVYRALVLGVKDYLHKCGFSRAVLGLSGGIDSAVTACLATAALGPERVLGVAMPSPFSSEGSVADARALARNLDIELLELPIGEVYDRYRKVLSPAFAGRPEDATEENIQARIRGNLLMAISNKQGQIVLTTGNKSELAVGYCTLYGDMSGGLAVLADVTKTMVYRLARFINRERELIPPSSIAKPPSAELRPGQTDQDTLPPYEVLDPILELYVDEGRSPEDIVRSGFDRRVVAWVVAAVDRNEYKRRQAAPGLKVSSKAFGAGRRLPIAGRYEH